MNDHITSLQCRAMNKVWDGNDPDGDVDKMYIPKVFIEEFARQVVLDCTGIWEAIDNGNKINGTSFFPEAVFRQYGLIKK